MNGVHMCIIGSSKVKKIIMICWIHSHDVYNVMCNACMTACMQNALFFMASTNRKNWVGFYEVLL